MTPAEHAHRRRRVRQHTGRIRYLFALNTALAFVWLMLIPLILVGPLDLLKASVPFVIAISLYANMMGNLATASALYSSLVAHQAHDTALDAAADVREMQR